MCVTGKGQPLAAQLSDAGATGAAAGSGAAASGASGTASAACSAKPCRTEATVGVASETCCVSMSLTLMTGGGTGAAAAAGSAAGVAGLVDFFGLGSAGDERRLMCSDEATRFASASGPDPKPRRTSLLSRAAASADCPRAAAPGGAALVRSWPESTMY